MQLTNFRSLIPKYKAIFLDSYGVVKNHMGLIDGVPAVIEYIRECDIPFKILTNDASRSPQKQSQRFAESGLHLEASEIITSGMMAKKFLKNKISSGKVAYLGTKSSAQYIIRANLEAIPVADVNLLNIDEVTAMVFLDDEGFNWNVDINATLNLLRKRNIPAIVANSDTIYPVAKNNVAIATGGIAQLVENILGRKFIHFGKPDSQMFMYAFEKVNEIGYIKRKDVLMVGDTLHTDILGGNKFGVDTCLVLSGNTSAKNAKSSIRSSGVIPDFICESILSYKS